MKDYTVEYLTLVRIEYYTNYAKAVYSDGFRLLIGLKDAKRLEHDILFNEANCI